MEFWSRVRQGAPDECWEWMGPIKNGYGRVGRGGKAHRRAYELAFGVELPPHDPKTQSSVRHLYHNKLCCNPAHLRLGTHKENMHDSERDGLHQAHERHGLAKLSEDQIDEIRYLRDCKVRVKTVAEEYNISPSHVSDIANRRKWA